MHKSDQMPLQFSKLSVSQGMVKKLTPTEAHLSTGEVMPYGICVWSTGVGPTSFTTSLPFAKTARGRIAIDGEMRVLQHVDPQKTGAGDPHKPSDVSKLLPIANMPSRSKCESLAQPCRHAQHSLMTCTRELVDDHELPLVHANRRSSVFVFSS